ncbi:hypothetical protein MML48_3g00014709 [Holotrichia oblita]|uniref:Uncharacterized protein n=1 Tax=Holotrichia oblita TaxID=644536 RepID=A0ACB9TDA6_HOLOL|nr:hypothetical protein MML48_3g00014709 [Holotrichia oblita]
MMPKRKKIAKDNLMLSRGKMLVHLVTAECNTPLQKEEGVLAVKNKRTMNWLGSNDFNIDAENLNDAKVRREEVDKKVDNVNDTVIKLTLQEKLNKEIDGEEQRNNLNDLHEEEQPTEENYKENIPDNINVLSDKPNKVTDENSRPKRKTKTYTQLTPLDIANETCHISAWEEKSTSEPSIDEYSSSSFVPSTVESDDSNSTEIKMQNSFVVRFPDYESNTEPVLSQNINIDSITVVAATTEPEKKIFSTNFLNHYVQQSENKKKKKTTCKFCRNNVTNFERHLERHHGNENEVKELLNLPKTSKEHKTMRRNIIALLRFETQFEEFIEGVQIDNNKLPCAHCKRLVKPSYLRRHFKVCVVKPINKTGQKIQHRAQSQTLLACAADFGNTEATLRVKNEVFSKMKADEIGLVAKKDALIRHYGENYLKKHKRAQIMTACSNKLRECARLLIEVRRRTNNTVLTFFDMLNTNLFDSIVASSKTISGYEEDNKKFKAPSLAIHMGTTLKQICDLCSHLILKGVFKCTNIEEKLKDIKRLKHMIETQWNCEISSLAIKDLAENKWNKPIRLPLTKDVIKFRDYVIQISNENFNVLQTNKSNKNAFKILTESSLCLTILFNRRRIGDVQYVHVESYLKNFETMDQEEFSSVLTESEKVLTSTYKRVVAGGKGSRAITILFPKNLQKYIDLLLEIRRESDMVPNTNPITQDAYQTAKVSKLLALFDKGQGFEYKGKPLNDINLASLKEPESDIDEDIDIESSGAVTSTSNEQLPSTSQEFSEQSDISDDKSVIKQCKDKKSKTVKEVTASVGHKSKKTL